MVIVNLLFISYIYCLIFLHMENKFKVGDVVCLKSGSFNLVVDEVEDDNNVTVIYFDDNKVLQRETISADALVSYLPQ